MESLSSSNGSKSINNSNILLNEDFSALPFFECNYNEIFDDFLSNIETLTLPKTKYEWAYVLCFAIDVEHVARLTFSKKECIGCLLTSLSLTNHTCLMNFPQALPQVFELVVHKLASGTLIEKCFRNLCAAKKWQLPEMMEIKEMESNSRSIWRRLIFESILNNYYNYPETWKNIINNVYKSYFNMLYYYYLK